MHPRSPGAIHLGTRTLWGGTEEPVALSREERRRHVFLVGKTGTGKSTLLRHLVAQDLAGGEGCALIDPHGDLAEQLLDLVPGHRFDDVVYLDPADPHHSIGINLLAPRFPAPRHLIVSSLLSSFRALWGDSWGPRLEYVLGNALAAACETDGTLLSASRLLMEPRYRAQILRRVRDPMTRAFWEIEWPSWGERVQGEAVASVQNKLGRLLATPPLRHIFGQRRSTVDLRFMMDDGRVLLVNLSKGRIGEDAANILGSLLVSHLHLAALARADTPEPKRRDFHLYLDEFHTLTTDSFAGILSEARKYRLTLTLATQFLDQVRPTVRSALFGNAGTLIAFGVGATDAALLADELAPLSPEQLLDLERFRVAVRINAGDRRREPFLATIPAPSPAPATRGETLRRRSREKYSRPREEIEERIARWMER